MSTITQDVLEAIYSTDKTPIIACDRDKIIAAKGLRKEEVINRRITADLEEILNRRELFIYDEERNSLCFPVEGIEWNTLACAPIIASGDVVGAIIFVSEDSAPTTYATESKITLLQ